jgi:hypothetical protein
MATWPAGPLIRWPAIVTLPEVAGSKPANDAQQRGFSAPRPAEQRDDFVVAQGEGDVIEHEEIAYASLGVSLAEAFDLDERRTGSRGNGIHCSVSF